MKGNAQEIPEGTFPAASGLSGLGTNSRVKNHCIRMVFSTNLCVKRISVELYLSFILLSTKARSDSPDHTRSLIFW